MALDLDLRNVPFKVFTVPAGQGLKVALPREDTTLRHRARNGVGGDSATTDTLLVYQEKDHTNANPALAGDEGTQETKIVLEPGDKVSFRPWDLTQGNDAENEVTLFAVVGAVSVQFMRGALDQRGK